MEYLSEEMDIDLNSLSPRNYLKITEEYISRLENILHNFTLETAEALKKYQELIYYKTKLDSNLNNFFDDYCKRSDHQNADKKYKKRLKYSKELKKVFDYLNSGSNLKKKLYDNQFLKRLKLATTYANNPANLNL